MVPRFMLAVVMLGALPAIGRAAGSCDGSQAAMNTCAEAQREDADRRLNAAYAHVLARLRDPDDAAQRAALRRAENAWIGFRDAECGFETADADGGSMHAMSEAQCAAGLSDDRAAVLERMASCHARDGSCVLGP